MDEQDARIAAVFRDAAAEVPPPGFDAADVVATSRRITRRRRSALAGGALAVLAVVGFGVAAGLSGGTGSELTTASAGAQDDGAQGKPPGAAGAKAAQAAPEAAPPADAAGSGGAAGTGAAGTGGAGSGGAGSESAAPGPAGSDPATERSASAPLGPGVGECANRQDPALRALVAQALPETDGAPEAMTTLECRPGGERGVALEVRDGAVAGLLAVTYLPPGEPVDPPGIAEAPAAVVRTAPTASGGTVVVSSRADRAGDPSPFAGRLDAVTIDLAPRL